MAVKYLKKAKSAEHSSQSNVVTAVQTILDDIRNGGDERALHYAKTLDKWTGPIIVDDETIAKAKKNIPEQLQKDIKFAHENVRRFAEAQLATIKPCELELQPGIVAGQKHIPVTTAGCYVPGGRYSHIASAIMTITTAKVAGVENIIACSPTRPEIGIPPAILFTMELCGADTILNLGGVQGIAAMAFGLFEQPKANILVGPGNQFVAEAKRILFGEVGIDMFAGPTDLLVIADEHADPEIVAADLVGQAEHGYNSPVWLVTNSNDIATRVEQKIPQLISSLPDLNGKNAEAAWRDYGEIILCETREEMAATADSYAPEHLHVQCVELDWWLARLKAYGSLFLGEEPTVAYGDKASGPNHVLPTSGAAKYTGGLSVHKFMKTVTWQRANAQASQQVAEATARISRLEGMEAHARSADVRLQKYFPGKNLNTSIN